MACSLMFDDGTCMDQRLPRGLTDLEAIYKWTGDEKTAKFMLYQKYKSTADGVNWINSLYINAESLDYDFVWKETGELIGSGGVYRPHEPRPETWSIGYNIRSDMWGKGITAEAMS